MENKQVKAMQTFLLSHSISCQKEGQATVILTTTSLPLHLIDMISY